MAVESARVKIKGKSFASAVMSTASEVLMLA